VNEWLALKRAVVVKEVGDYFFCFFCGVVHGDLFSEATATANCLR